MATERAIFAGGCFWCMVQPFEEREGILSVISGYTGGNVENPTYEQVKKHLTGHTEAVEDRGDNYRPVIFVENEEQEKIAKESKAQLQASGNFDSPIVTSIEAVQKFWPAEDYHQGFYKKNPEDYAQSSKIRHDFLEKQWKK